MWKYQGLHQRAKEAVKKWNKAEQEVVEVLSSVERVKAYLEMGYQDLFSYGMKYLELSPNQAYAIQAVVRKSKQVPELLRAVEGGLSLYKAQTLLTQKRRRKVEVEEVLAVALDLYLERAKQEWK